MSSTHVLPQPTGPTPLEERLINLIEENGPISVGDYMADALGHPQHGYYISQDPFGKDGDFTTSPDISQVFGELIGAWLIESWQAMGAPSLFNLVELGPGRGTLMSDILRIGRLRPAFLDAARVFMVETSGRLRVQQQRTLDNTHPALSWVDHIEDVPLGPTLIVANEFFDCLPIRQFVRTAEKSDEPWRERLVGVNRDGDEARLCFTLSKQTYPDRPGMPNGSAPEAIYEECEAGQKFIEEIAPRLKDYKSRMLIIDYGHGRSAFGDTFQAVRRHQAWHPLASPGHADITAHVDFAALARTARAQELRVDGPVHQGDFLTRLGLVQRVEKLMQVRAEDKVKGLVKSGAERLVDPGGMGKLFKVMSISSPSLDMPPGFE